MSKSKIHLDAAGAPPLIPNIIENWTREITNEMYLNPHSCFKTKQRIKSIRNRILNHFNVSNETHSVIFTSNSTAACKLFAESINWSGKNFQYLNSNHTSIVGIRETVELNLGSVECINDTSQLTEGSFVAFPAQCNFSGQRINLEWINSKFKTLIDTASYLSSSKFDLSETKADCIIISFYKLFGFPTVCQL